MTGFGSGEALLTGSGPGTPQSTGKLTIEIRAVNHRYLEVRVRAPTHMPDLATVVEALARERLTRGRFDIGVRIEGAVVGAITVNEQRARSVFASLSALRDELAPGTEIPLSLLCAVPDLFVPAIDEDEAALRSAASTALDRALEALDTMRLREGAALGADIVRRLITVRSLAQSIAQRAPDVVELYKKKLKERAEKLRSSVPVEIETGRLEYELALYADRVDICEELTRLDSHTSHFESLLVTSGAIGRRFDFLLQEMAREANTIGAKSQDASIAHAVVELKAEIERMREQVQNIE